MDNEKNEKKKRGRKKAIQKDEQTGLIKYKDPICQRFVERYVSEEKMKTDAEWAKEFNVCPMTILRWRQAAKYEINRIINERNQDLMQDLSKLGSIAVKNIYKTLLNNSDEQFQTTISIKILEMLGINKKNPVQLQATISITDFKHIYTIILSLIRKHFGKIEFKTQLDAFNNDLGETIKQWKESNFFNPMN